MTQLLDRQSLKAQIILKSAHPITRAAISKSALKVLDRLNKAGFQAYLVGGSVRDLLLGKRPKDFDVVTDAVPEKVRKLFSNSIIIGKRFRLVHVRYGHDIVEVATFRGEHTDESGKRHKDTGMILRDNVFGDLEDDVLRRDFTVNALYFNIADNSVVDYVDGMSDIKSRTIRVMGDPEERYTEDPVRMLRAIRLAAKLQLTIEEQTSQAIKKMRHLIDHVAAARLFDEITKMSLCGHVKNVYEMLNEYEIFERLFPAPFEAIKNDKTDFSKQFILQALTETDKRIADGKTINPAFLMSVYFWMPLQNRINYHQSHGVKLYPAISMAEADIIKSFSPLIMPRRLVSIIRDIWRLQYHMKQNRRNRIYRCFYHPRFRAAYDFMLIRNAVGEDLEQLCQFWTEFQDANLDDQERLISQRQSKKKPQKRKRPVKKRSSKVKSGEKSE